MYKAEDDFTGQLHLNNNITYNIQNTYIENICNEIEMKNSNP